MAVTKQTSGELKTRVNTCLSKLADRDTLSMAANELVIIARKLPNDAFAPFINCLLATDSSEKSPVRRHCVYLLGVLSAAHGNALSPHLSRMISTVLRRLRDPDSAVRSACAEAVSSIATHVKSPAPFNSIIKPFADALFQEQDSNVQIGASLCLSAAADAVPDPDAAELRKLLPRILKLLKTDCFKAKPNLLSSIGTVVSSGCVRSKTLLSSVVRTAIEFLSSNDWAARKAAAEVLEKVAAAEGNLAAELRDGSVAALESRRFDKVKVVRETMNRALETWRDLPGKLSGHVSSSEDSNSCKSSKSCSPNPQARCQVSVGSSEPPHPTKPMLSTRSSPASSCSSTTTNSETSTAKHEGFKLNPRRNFMSQMVPFNDDDDDDDDLGMPTTDARSGVTNISLICKQIAQIESQQLYLFDLLQSFIRSSQKGMSSLERRVDGLERMVNEMSSHGFAISMRRMPGGLDTSCVMPGAEFLSPELWRKAQGHGVSSKFEIANTLMVSAEMLKPDSRRN